MDDPYIDLIDDQWHNITAMYHLFRKKKPIMEYDIGQGKILAYPAKSYINNLSTKTRKVTKKNYIKACKNNEFILFIRDEKNQIFRSYNFPLSE